MYRYSNGDGWGSFSLCAAVVVIFHFALQLSLRTPSSCAVLNVGMTPVREADISNHSVSALAVVHENEPSSGTKEVYSYEGVATPVYL